MNDLVYRLRKRSEIRRQIPTRKSVQNNEPDRIADLLDEAAKEIETLTAECDRLYRIIELNGLNKS
jgi:polyhydroxyalkanoate synthesis regulator phasin